MECLAVALVVALVAFVALPEIFLIGFLIGFYCLGEVFDVARNRVVPQVQAVADSVLTLVLGKKTPFQEQMDSQAEWLINALTSEGGGLVLDPRGLRWVRAGKEHAEFYPTGTWAWYFTIDSIGPMTLYAVTVSDALLHTKIAFTRRGARRILARTLCLYEKKMAEYDPDYHAIGTIQRTPWTKSNSQTT